MSQLITKFIADNAVTDIKQYLRNGLPQRARNGSNTAYLDLFLLSGTDLFTILREMSMNSNKISGLADGTLPNDAVNLGQVEKLISGLSDPKDACRGATVAQLPASTYNNGAGTGEGATITSDVNGAFPAQDSVGYSVGQDILVKNEPDALRNGIYRLTQLGDAGSPWILTRRTDADIGSADSGDPDNDPRVVSQGMFCQISEGAVNASTGYILSTPDPITLGTTGLNFSRLGATITGGNGIDITNDVASIDLATNSGLGFVGNQLLILVDDNLQTGSTKISASGVLQSSKSFEESFVLTTTDVSNGYVDLQKIGLAESVQLFPRNGIKQKALVDYNVSQIGGAGGKTRVTFAGDLATGGSAALEAGDVVDIAYLSLDYT